ncbi:MAG TPA: hypothetical protein VHX44_02480 [Planctomycetota bacterium]|nr:hypothetical protein [Planctomycetota bacterium]
MPYARICGLVLLVALLRAAEPAAGGAGDITLRDFRPVSLYNVPRTDVRKAKYPAIDFHTHDYAKTPAEVDE